MKILNQFTFRVCLILAGTLVSVSHGASLWTLDFESNGGYTPSITEFSDSSSDYFCRVDDSGSATGVDVNGNSLANVTLTGVSGYGGDFYFAGQDIDGEGASLPVDITVNNIDISAHGSLQFSVKLATENPGANEWDGSDYVHFQYDIDNSGSWSDLLLLEEDVSGFIAVDTDGDGEGDGATVDETFSSYSASITGTGSEIDIRVVFRLNAGDEDLCIDDLEITGTPSGDTDSDVDSPASPVASGTIDSLADTSAEAVDVFKFDIVDAGTADGEPTKVTTVEITPGANNTADWTNTIAGVILENGVTPVSATSTTITDSAITFTIADTELNVADGTTANMTLSIWLNEATKDGDVLDFMIDADAHGFVADGSGSAFLSDFGMDIHGNDQTIEVTAGTLSALVITEAMPVSSHGGGPSNGDWWELHNSGSVALNLTGFIWNDTNDATTDRSVFPSLTIGAGETIVIVDESTANTFGSNSFTNDWGGGFTAISRDDFDDTAGTDIHFSGLDGTGDSIYLFDDSSDLITSVTFGSATSGASFEWLTSGNAAGISVDGENGAFVAPEDDGTAPGTDVGSPGVVQAPAAEPTVQASEIIFHNIQSGQFDVSWDNGNGAGRLVIAREGAAPSADPVDAVNYSDDSDFSGSGSALGGGTVVYIGTGTNFTLTGLTDGNTYHLQVFEYNSGASADQINYLASAASGNPASQVALDDAPTTQSAYLAATLGTTSVDLVWTNGNGDGRIVVLREGSQVDWEPSNATAYSPDADFSSATDQGSGNKVVFSNTGTNQTITGLTAGSQYFFKVFEYIGVAGSRHYLVDEALAGSFRTASATSGTNTMALWTFGPDAAGYTTNVTVDQVIGTPTVELFNQAIDANGKDGEVHFDGEGNYYAWGQSAAWDDVAGAGDGGEFIVKLNARAWTNMSVRFDYRADSATSLDVDYSLNEGSSWTAVATDAAIVADDDAGPVENWYAYRVDLPVATADQTSLWIRVSGMADTGDNLFEFDNLEVLGERVLVDSSGLAITEVMSDSNDAGEEDWWELFNTGSGYVDLTGYIWNDDTGGSNATFSLFPTIYIEPNESIVIVNHNTADTATFASEWSGSFRAISEDEFTGAFEEFNSTGDEVYLYDANSNLVDTVSFGSATESQSFEWSADGTTLGLSVDGENDAETSSEGDQGSPGSALAVAPAAALAAGDVAFVAWDADVNDGFAIVALADIPAGTDIYFSDNPWTDTPTPQFDGVGEGALAWDTGGSVIPAGTVIRFDAGALTADYGTLTDPDPGFDLTTGSNDGILAYLGGSASTPTTFLAGIGNGSTAAVCFGTLNGTGLSAGTTVVLLGSAVDVAEYMGSRRSETAFADYLPLIMDENNWLMQDDLGDQSTDRELPIVPFRNHDFVITDEGTIFRFW